MVFYLSIFLIILILVGVYLRFATFIKLITNLVYLRFRDQMLKLFGVGCVHKFGGILEITYCSPGSLDLYTVVSKKQRMRTIVEVKDAFGNDITSSFLRQLGIGYNFHSIPTTPGLLGYSTIRVEYKNGGKKVFETDEIIVL